MPLLIGKLFATVVLVTVAGAVAVALGAFMALVEDADQRAAKASEPKPAG